MPPACCGAGWISMSSSACSATPASPRRPGTCTSRTPTWRTPWTRRSRSSELLLQPHLGVGIEEEELDDGQVGAVRLVRAVSSTTSSPISAHLLQLLDPLGDVRGDEGLCEVEP